jgi:serine/threonine protein kinase
VRSLEDVKPGDTLGRYELLVPVAQGGMAAVWAARQRGSRGFQRIVAIKTILPGLVDDAMFEQMFLDEASLASRIRHPHVAQILDLGEENEVLYLVMEWVDGEALSVLIRTVGKLTGKPIPIPIASRIIMQAAAGLHSAHELRDDDGQLVELVHRDVSPQNILLTYDGIVKVVDFGVAKAVGRTAVETAAGQLKGKVPFMSPEQARGGRIDRRTDVFALGAIYYQLVTGVHPFRGDNDLVTLNNIISRPPFRPRLNDPTFPVEIEDVLMTSLAKDVAKRYATMADFEAAIGSALSKMGLVANDKIVADFMHGVMGDRAKKRREALKQAMKAADEHVGPAHGPAPQVMSPSSSGVGPLPIDRASMPSIVTRGDSVPDARVTDPTLAAVESGGASATPEALTLPPPRAPSRKKVAIAAGSVAAVALVATIAVVSTRGGSAAEGPTAATDPSAAVPGASASAAPSASVAAAASAEPGAAASAQPGAAASAEPGAVASAAPAASDVPAVAEVASTNEPPRSIADLPRVAGGHGEGEHGGKTVPASQTHGTTAAATASAQPTVQRRKVPEVQNPGF